MFEVFGWYSVGVGCNGTICGFSNSIVEQAHGVWGFSSVEVTFEFAYERLPEFVGLRHRGEQRSDVTGGDISHLERMTQILPLV